MPKRKYVRDVFSRPMYGSCTDVQRAVFDSKELLQRLQLDVNIDAHNGCVNTIVWNETGSLLLSGSDDHNLVITDIFKPKPVSSIIRTPHTANIISAKFLSGTSDTKLVSCADSTILLTDINRPDQFSILNCYTSKVYEVLSIPGDPHSFLSCGEDGTVRWVDTRVHPACTDTTTTCQKEVIIECDKGVGSISLNPVFPWELAVGASDSCVRMYDRRMLSTKSVSSNYNSGLSGLFSKFSVPEFKGKSRRITSVKYRPDGREVLVSFSSDYLYVFNPKGDCTTGKSKRLKVGRPSHKWRRAHQQQQQPVKKFRLRGDWSDTGPRSRPESESAALAGNSSSNTDQENPGMGEDSMTSQAALMQRMTFALSRMLNDPGTRLAMQRLGNPNTNNNDNLQGDQSEDSAGNQGDPSGAGDGTTQSMPGSEPQTMEASSASLIQERWRQYRERRLAPRRQQVIEVETTNDDLAESLLHPQHDSDDDDQQSIEVELPGGQQQTGGERRTEETGDNENRRTEGDVASPPVNTNEDTSADNDEIEQENDGNAANQRSNVSLLDRFRNLHRNLHTDSNRSGYGN
jgi:hypothetical protein